MTVFKWVKSPAASNDSIDLTGGGITWVEGQAPSTVNDSARGMMAAIAKYRDDIAGRIVTTGTSTAYSLTSNQVFTTLALMDGAMIAFVPNVTCSTPLTLNVDALGAKPLRTAPSVEVQAGQLIAGTPYAATYSNSTAVWTLQNILGNFTGAVPIGSVLPYAGTTAPNSNFALCFGQSIATASFPALFAILSYTFGGAGANFNVPDLRGRIAAGKDNMGGSTGSSPIGIVNTGIGTINGATLGSTGGTATHTLSAAQMPSHNHNPITITDPGHGHTVAAGPALFGGPTAGGGAWGATGTFSITSNVTGISASGSNIGGDAAHPILQPTIILNHIIRVL